MTVHQYLVIALAVHLHLALGIDRQLRHLADDLLQRRRGRLRIVIHLISHLLGRVGNQRLLNHHLHLVYHLALLQSDIAHVGILGSLDTLHERFVPHHRKMHVVRPRLLERQSETSVAVGIHHRMRGRIALGRYGHPSRGFTVGGIHRAARDPHLGRCDETPRKRSDQNKKTLHKKI